MTCECAQPAPKRSATARASEDAALGFHNVSKTFDGDVRAVRDVSLDVERGSFCVLLGPSGSGKTTLLRTVNGLAAPFEGSVVVDGETVTPSNFRRIRRKIATIHQHFGLVGRLTVAQNVMAGLAPSVGLLRAAAQWYPVEIRRKACALIERVGLGEEHLNRRTRDLSGGQQQRVGIARALIADPAIILADEPVASLDPKISGEILSLLRAAARERGVTVLCTLHQLAYAHQFADRIVAMREGEIIFDCPADELKPKMASQIYSGDAVAAPAPNAGAERAQA